MAEGWIRHHGQSNITVHSAGIEAHGLNQKAVAVMAEAGVDISAHRSELIDTYADQSFDLVLTVCDSAKERCPILPGAHRTVHHSFPDPASATGTEDAILQVFREVRDEIKQYTTALVKELAA